MSKFVNKSIILAIFVLTCFSPLSGQSAETTSPSEIQIQSTGVDLTAPRHLFSVTELSSSEWLIAGGHLEKNPKGKVSSSAEVLSVSKDGKIQNQLLDSHMKIERWGHAATRTSAGDVFICGGSRDLECEKYSNKDRSFASAGKLFHARSASAQILLPSGKVMISGGYNLGDPSLGKTLASVEIYDPKSNSITPLGDMSVGRAGHALFLFENKVYAIGGLTPESAVIEEFDEKSGVFSKTEMILPYSLKDFQFHQYEKAVFLMGGTKSDGNSIDKVIRVDLKKRIVEELPGQLLEPREDLTICFQSNQKRAVVLGGEIKGNQRNGLHSDKVDMIYFHPFHIAPTSVRLYRDDAKTISLPTGDCLVLGGTDETEEMTPMTLRLVF